MELERWIPNTGFHAIMERLYMTTIQPEYWADCEQIVCTSLLSN